MSLPTNRRRNYAIFFILGIICGAAAFASFSYIRHLQDMDRVRIYFKADQIYEYSNGYTLKFFSIEDRSDSSLEYNIHKDILYNYLYNDTTITWHSAYLTYDRSEWKIDQKYCIQRNITKITHMESNFLIGGYKKDVKSYMNWMNVTLYTWNEEWILTYNEFRHYNPPRTDWIVNPSLSLFTPYKFSISR